MGSVSTKGSLNGMPLFESYIKCLIVTECYLIESFKTSYSSSKLLFKNIYKYSNLVMILMVS